MDKGYLIVSVYVENISEPIDNALVRVVGEKYNNTFNTGVDGKTISIELDAPLKEYSLIPQNKIRPYSTYNIIVSKQGFATTVINNVIVFPGETSLQDAFLKPTGAGLSKLAVKENIIDLPPHSLWETTKGATVRNNINDDRVYPNTLIPEYLTVHNGMPTDTSVSNYNVKFSEYLKSVAAREIYSTWPVEAIKSNIHAIASFTLNRIFTEWYVSRGYTFTVTSLSSYDQSYVPNGTTFKSISDVVDQIFNYYIQQPNKNYPFLAQYDDGINVNNPGWLSQWGSKSLADQGYKALDILKYYYGNGITLVQANAVEGLPTSFPGYNLKVGSCGEPVQKIQIMINTISGSYPAIPKIIPTDGQYLANTANSISIFQKTFGLPITGIVDFVTWYKISYIYIAVAKLLQK